MHDQYGKRNDENENAKYDQNNHCIAFVVRQVCSMSPKERQSLETIPPRRKKTNNGKQNQDKQKHFE